MSEKEVILTLAGLKKLEDELELNKTQKRRDIAGRIKQAIEFGDISENSEYDDAKNEQAFIEGRIITKLMFLQESCITRLLVLDKPIYAMHYTQCTIRNA